MAQNLGASAKSRPRTRPREDRGWAPLRADAPGRAVRRRGSFPDLDTAEARAEAVADLRVNVYAASTIPGVETWRRFLTKALKRWGQERRRLTTTSDDDV